MELDIIKNMMIFNAYFVILAIANNVAHMAYAMLVKLIIYYIEINVSNKHAKKVNIH